MAHSFCLVALVFWGCDWFSRTALCIFLRAPHPCSRRRSDLGKRHDGPEARLQVACKRWADEQDLLVVGTAGGAAYKFGGRTANAMKAKGVEPGQPDLLILTPGGDGTYGLAIELKIGKNELSEAQRAWFARARAKNWRCGEARSLEEFVALVHEHQSVPAPVVESVPESVDTSGSVFVDLT